MALADKTEAADMLQGKKSKKAAGYRPSSEEMDEDWCGSCVHYMNKGKPSSPCELVAGTVYDNDVCDLFEEDLEEQAPDEIPREQEGEIIDSLL